MSENQRFSDAFRGYRNETLGQNGLNQKPKNASKTTIALGNKVLFAILLISKVPDTDRKAATCT